MTSNQRQRYVVVSVTAFLIPLILGAGIYQYLQKTGTSEEINEVPNVEAAPTVAPSDDSIKKIGGSIKNPEKEAYSWEWVKTHRKKIVIIGAIGIEVIRRVWDKNKRQMNELELIKQMNELERQTKEQKELERQKQLKQEQLEQELERQKQLEQELKRLKEQLEQERQKQQRLKKQLE